MEHPNPTTILTEKIVQVQKIYIRNTIIELYKKEFYMNSHKMDGYTKSHNGIV